MNNLVALIASLVAKHFPTQGSTYPTGWDGWDEFLADAESHGFRKLGNGYFSVAFSHDSVTDKVIKVGFKKEDSGAAYAAYCRMNQGQPGIPAIHDIQRHSHCYTVVMDWLKPFERRYDGTERYLNDIFSLISMSVECSAKDRVEDFDWSVGAATIEQAEARYSYAQAVQETGRKIHEFFHGIAAFDCHSGNVMIDAAGNMVITDPVSFTEGIAGWDALDEDVLMGERDRLFRAKCKARHEGKLNKADLRKAARKAYKAHKRSREVRKVARQKRDNDHQFMFGQVVQQHRVGRIGSNVWFENGVTNLKGIAKANRAKDVFAIQAGMALPIDDLMQARFMG